MCPGFPCFCWNSEYFIAVFFHRISSSSTAFCLCILKLIIYPKSQSHLLFESLWYTWHTSTLFLEAQSRISSTILSVNTSVPAEPPVSPVQMCGPSWGHQMWCHLCSTCRMHCGRPQDWTVQRGAPATVVCAAPGSIGFTDYISWLEASNQWGWGGNTWEAWGQYQRRKSYLNVKRIILYKKQVRSKWDWEQKREPNVMAGDRTSSSSLFFWWRWDMELESKEQLSLLYLCKFTEDMTYLYIPTLADHPVCWNDGWMDSRFVNLDFQI